MSSDFYLQSTLSDLRIDTPAAFKFYMFSISFFHPFTFSLCVSYLAFDSDNLCLLIEELSLFTFTVMIEKYLVIPAFLMVCLFVCFFQD
jgi:hypothetical protein